MTLTPVLTELRENADVSQHLKVADIAVVDPDGVGSSSLSLTGLNAGFFEIYDDGNGPALYLKAGADIDYEKHQHLDVTVNVDDPSIGAAGTIEDHKDFSLAIGDVKETQGPITLDGALGEWDAASRLDAPNNGVAGYAVYGTYADDTNAFVIGLKTDGTAIGANSTIWLNSDRNNATGYGLFGTPGLGGADYKVEFDASGTPSLYSLDDQGVATLVSGTLDYVFNADHSTIELALPSSLLGGSTHTGVYIDVNNSVFLPTVYDAVEYHIDQKPAPLPQDPSIRIGIVYSETSADNYFSKTAYGQLFMAAQYQAMQAGVPFDILTEDQLTDIQNLVNANGQLKYDALVFPDFANVKSSQLQAITDTLTTAVHDYHIGLIAAGNFMTNTETGSAIAGDSYARMKLLLGVTREGGGATNGVVLHAGDGSHPINHDFAPGSVIGSYTNAGYDTFGDVTGSGQTLFTQTAAGSEQAAVIATTGTGARNVHFATDAILGNNNILQHAIDWVAQGNAADTPDVGLELSRGSSIFLSRTDLDQSQEHFDVAETNPQGIYDALLPVLQGWYQQYNFVGSYYANIGADPSGDADRWTDWSAAGKSLPFYQALLAMGNEIGTHSYTHPEDTNYLLTDSFTEADRQGWLDHLSTDVPSSVKTTLSNMTLAQTQSQLAALLAQVDPATHANADLLINALSDVDRQLLAGSYRFQFEYSREILSQHLGLAISGAAVPGAPETVTTSEAIMQYVDYLSGGYAGIGAGYPGAFGFLDPAHASQVYFAPNVPFDFSLVEFQHMTAAEASAVWSATFDQLTNGGQQAIINLPWHDYGPVDWDTTNGTGAGHGPGYSEAMFTDFIAHAYAAGTEFVTNADLANRILSFVQSDVEVSKVGNQIVAHVSGSDEGKFALSIDTDKVIASVDNWYAWDGTKVFVPKNGGTFSITLGDQAADVTHIAKLPMRANLLNVTGTGSDLDYSFNGSGAVGVDVKSGGGVVVNGVDDATMSGQNLTLTHAALGVHAASVNWVNGTANLTGTDGDDFLFGTGAGTRIDGGRGTDALTGGGGADVFVYAPGDGADTVRDFNLAEDHIELDHSGFATASLARAAFTDTANGATLAFQDGDRLTLSHITVAELQDSHILLSLA